MSWVHPNSVIGEHSSGPVEERHGSKDVGEED